MKEQIKREKEFGTKPKQYTAWSGLNWLAPGRFLGLQTGQPKWRATVHAILILSRANRSAADFLPV